MGSSYHHGLALVGSWLGLDAYHVGLLPVWTIGWAFAWFLGVTLSRLCILNGFCLSTCFQRCFVQNIFSQIQVELGQ